MPDDKQTTAPSSTCVAGCGFFGSSSFEGMCSKCFHDARRRTHSEGGASTASGREAVANVGRLDAADLPECAGAGAGVATPVRSVGAEARAEAPAKRKVQKKRNRCFQCRTKVGVLGFECRCGYVYCGACRHAEEHNCDADYKEAARAALEQENTSAAFEKMERV